MLKDSEYFEVNITIVEIEPLEIMARNFRLKTENLS